MVHLRLLPAALRASLLALFLPLATSSPLGGVPVGVGALGDDGRCQAGGCAAKAVEGLELLQRESHAQKVANKPSPQNAGNLGIQDGKRDLVFQHIPYNFGHTIENVALAGSSVWKLMTLALDQDDLNATQQQERWKYINTVRQPNAEVWGHLRPELNVRSNVTGCPLYFTPGKHWPKDVAEAYFGAKTIFGMLRDPYERLVAFFRGSLGDTYGGWWPEFLKTCDVNGAVK